MIASKMRTKNRQPEKGSECQTLVLNDGPFSNSLAVFLFRRRSRLRSRAYVFHCSIRKRRGKPGRQVYFNESHVLYCIILRSLLLQKIRVERFVLLYIRQYTIVCQKAQANNLFDLYLLRYCIITIKMRWCYLVFEPSDLSSTNLLKNS